MSVRQVAQVRGGEAGVSLVELLIVAAISVVVTALAGTALFQFNKLTRLQHDALTLDHQLQKAAALLGHDVVAAAGGMVTGNTLTLTVPVHTFGDPEDPSPPLTVTYSVVDDTLVRDGSSGSIVAARYLDAVDFGGDGEIGAMLSLTLTVAVREESRTAAWGFWRRPSD